MSIKPLILAMSLFGFSLNTLAASSELVQETKQASHVQKQHNAEREADFMLTEKEFKAQKNALIAERKKLQKESDELSSLFSSNEQSLATIEQQLHLETGSLGELFGVVRQTAKDLNSELKNSVTGSIDANNAQVINDIVEAKSLPSMTQLTGLWQTMVQQVQASSESALMPVTVINGAGHRSEINAYRLGNMALVGDEGFLRWDNKKSVATYYSQQPDLAPSVATLSDMQQQQVMMMAVDPSRGIMLEQLANSPTLKDRLQAGGVVGQIIIALLAIGLLISLFNGARLLVIRQQIRTQLKDPAHIGNNPLGRVLSVYDAEKTRSVEALELRLLETIVDEQQGLEKGLSMLKLLAALAPMLGLLGTVTGMIETFQVITQFGNGDPKVMAGGISMALVTTVLGLVAAMPLLLTHNILSSQAESIRTILEKQGLSLVAEQAEKETNNTPVGMAA
ncbi:MotA/TolQ/ExbB proton channel family protein [Aliivibrio salmonicida]|uniref:Biopolymer transport protein TolR n=1 Tax=Aliivibrio salmonicida (strain LFI1238) TaxID=316275 RepID=B6EQ95_ALISL|nr:MotA/TolQ/ExbB proton channel family protein [Aliivibrio salmonicida]AZL86316.1 MotA/TolQ/ExbB proton channel family protein [Aliivibrio salmonicida]CAQ80866.1 biopolymer transport protein TolR [Aliivibrio salmonicida LFI1238]